MTSASGNGCPRLSGVLGPSIGKDPMLRTHGVPCTTVAVLHRGNDEAFESTLLGVLESRQVGTEIVGIHDGRYADPHAIGDEIRLVVSDGSAPIDSIATAGDAAAGRYLRLVFSGAIVGGDCPLGTADAFADDRLAVVENGPRTDSAMRLDGSLWRTEVLRGVVRGCTWIDLPLVSRVYPLLLRRAGWTRSAGTLPGYQADAESDADALSLRDRRRLLAAGSCCGLPTSTRETGLLARAIHRIVPMNVSHRINPDAMTSPVTATLPADGRVVATRRAA